MRVIITGATGMVGKGVLYECLEHPRVSGVLVINRHTIGLAHPKLVEILLPEFTDINSVSDQLASYDACFFCLGVSSIGLNEEDYRKVTYNLTINVAETLLRQNQAMTFCYVSGQGTDATGKGKPMWARVKGQTENNLLNMGFKGAYMLRPGYIHPTRGIRSRTRAYNIGLAVVKPMYPLLKCLFPHSVTTTDNIGKAMIYVAQYGYPKKILAPRDINSIANAKEVF